MPLSILQVKDKIVAFDAKIQQKINSYKQANPNIKNLSDTGKCKIHTDVIDAFIHQVFVTAPKKVIDAYNNKYLCDLYLFETDFIKDKHEKL